MRNVVDLVLMLFAALSAAAVVLHAGAGRIEIAAGYAGMTVLAATSALWKTS